VQLAAPASPARSPEALELLLRVQRAVNALPMLHERDLVMKGAAAEAEVTKTAAEIATRVREGLAAPAPSTNAAVTHSSAVIVSMPRETSWSERTPSRR